MTNLPIIVQRVLPQISLVPIKTTGSTIPPTPQERGELQALIIYQDGSLAGENIAVNWRISGFAGGQNIKFYDANDQLLTMSQGAVTSFTGSNSLATVYVTCPSITIATVFVSSDQNQAEYGIQLIFHDPSDTSPNYTAPTIEGLQDVLHIPEDNIQNNDLIKSEASSYDTRYAARSDSDMIPTHDYRCAFILNNQCVSLNENVSANTEVYGYIPYNQMYANATTINKLKYIVSEINSGQSSPLLFLAEGTAYQMPTPFITSDGQLNTPSFTGSLDNGILTANSFVNGYLRFTISNFPFSCLYGLFTPMLFLDGWDPHDSTKRVTKKIALMNNDYYIDQSQLNNGIPINISQNVFHQIGAKVENNTIEYADLYLNYTINESENSQFYYNKADFSGLDT